MKDLSKKKSTKPTLFFFYLSKNIIWSIFLILKEEKEFPKLVFIEVENIDSKFISMDTHKNNKTSKFKNLIKKYILFFLKKFVFVIYLSNKKTINDSQIIHINKLKKSSLISNIFQNNLAFEEKSLFKSLFAKPNEIEINFLMKCFITGIELRSIFLNSKIFIFNGRYAPIYIFFKGLTNFEEKKLNRIEITYKSGKKHVYTSPLLWNYKMSDYVQNKYGIEKDLSFFNKRRFSSSGTDIAGMKLVNYFRLKNTSNYDIVLFLSSPHEFVGLSGTARDSCNLFKRSFRELLKFKKLGYSCAVRQHPNFRNCHSLDKKLFKKWFNVLSFYGISVFDFDASISSYKLIENSKIILTVGSSIGGEASFMNKYAFDLNKYSFVLHFKVVGKFDFDKVKNILDNHKYNDKYNEFRLLNFYKFSTFFSGFGHKIPNILL